MNIELKEKINKIVKRELIHKSKDGNESEIKKENSIFIKLGDLVSIVSVHEEDGEQTMIGICVGGVETSVSFNPVFYVPKLKRNLAGFESWWREIPEKDLELSCDNMVEKNQISWDSIENFCDFLLKMVKKREKEKI